MHGNSYNGAVYELSAGSTNKSTNEWMMYPEGPGYDATLRCKWDGEHIGSQYCAKEISHTELYGKGRNCK